MADLADIYGGDATFNPSIFAAIETGLKERPHEHAIVVRHQPAGHLADLVGKKPDSQSGDCVRWTYQELHRGAVRIAKGLLNAGVKPGSYIVTFIPNNAEWLLLLWALSLAKVGGSILDPGSLNPARREELTSYLTGIEPSAMILADDSGIEAVETVLEERQLQCPVKLVLSESTRGHTGWTTFTELAAPYSEMDDTALRKAAYNEDPTRTAFILYTSGTSSGKPKGCPRTAECMVVSTINQHFQHPERTKPVRRLLHTANFRVIAPLTAMRTWSTGGCVVLPGPGFEPKSALDAIEQERITDSLFIPAQLHAVAADPTVKDRDLSSIDMIYSGGDIVTKPLIEKSKTVFPNSAWMTGWGMTEGGGSFLWDFWDREDTVPLHGDISTIGRVNGGVRVRIFQDGRTVKRGETGELQLQTYGFVDHYLGGVNPQSWMTDDQGTWFRTGDLGTIDDNGYTFILGRLKDIIKRAGVTLTPVAIESCLQTYTGAQVSWTSRSRLL